MTGGLWWSWQNAVMMVVVLSTTSVLCTHFTDHYAVQVDGGVDEARRIAVQHGFVFVNEVLSVFAVISFKSDLYVQKHKCGQDIRKDRASLLIGVPKLVASLRGIEPSRVTPSRGVTP